MAIQVFKIDWAKIS